MDFEALRTILPKKTSAWRTSDVEKWIRYIHLEPYLLNFRTCWVEQGPWPSTAATSRN